MRTRIYEIVSRPKRGDNASCLYDLFIVIVAILSVVPVLFHSENLESNAKYVLSIIDVVTVYILCFDYLLNWMTFDIAQGKRGNWKEFLKYPFTFEAIINLLSILPTLKLLPNGFLFLRALRIVRLFRYSRQLTIIVNVFIQERKTLSPVFVLAVAYIFATALIMFIFEPQTFENFMDAVYWSTITLTTVGFGDITPASDLGHVLTSVTSIFGIFVFALPVGIITGGFLQQLKQKEGQGDDYYATGLFEGMDRSKFCLTPKKLKAYFKANPKLRLYICFIFAGIALNYLLCLFFSEFEQFLWLDTTGTAIVACALDPAAGIIVSFINNLIIAVSQDSPQNILYFSESALVALVYGYLFKQTKDGKLTFKNAGKILLIVIVVQGAIGAILALLINDGSFTTVFQNGYRDFLVQEGVNFYAACFLASIIDRIFDAVAVFVLVVFVLQLLKRKHFVARKWLEDNCSAAIKADEKAEVLPVDVAQDDAMTSTGILSCENEVLCLSRTGLQKIAAAMKKEANESKNHEQKLRCLSCAETILLLANSNVKSEEEFKELFYEVTKRLR